MKKFLVFSTILFSFLFCDIVFADNVNAAILNINANTFKNYVLPLRDDMKTIRTTMLSNMNYDSSTQDYFCLFNTSSGNPYGSCFVYSNTSGIKTSLDIGYSSVTAYFNFLIRNNSSTISYGKYNHSTNYGGNGFTINDGGYNTSGYSYGTTRSGSSGNQTFLTSVSSQNQMTINGNNYNIISYTPLKWVWVESSFDILFTSNLGHSVEFSELNVYESNFTNLINTYSPNDSLFDNNIDFIPSMPTPPTFTFNINNNTDEFNRLVSVDILLNIQDYNEDFIIQYITGDTSGTWTTIAVEYDSLIGYYFGWDNWTTNTIIFVRAIYEQEVVSSATQEISGIIPSYDSGQVNNYGNNSFGVTSKQVTIAGENLFNNITCSSQRAFVDNVCYVNDSDILDIQDKLDNKVHVRFNFSMHNINVPYQGDKYYLFGYRAYFDRVLLPFNISIVSGNLINSTATIIDYNVKEHGLYRDYIILFSSSSSQGLVAVDGVNLDFPEFSTIYDTFPQPFTLGFYNGVKFQQFDTMPTLSQIDNFYNNNTLDSLNSDSLLSYFTNFSVNDHGLSSVVLKPIDFLNHLTSSTCTPVEIPFPHSNQVIKLPCISSLFQTHLPSVFQLYQVIVSGLIFYRIGIDLFRIIKNLFNPENDKIEVVDL